MDRRDKAKFRSLLLAALIWTALAFGARWLEASQLAGSYVVTPIGWMFIGSVLVFVAITLADYFIDEERYNCA